MHGPCLQGGYTSGGLELGTRIPTNNYAMINNN